MASTHVAALPLQVRPVTLPAVHVVAPQAVPALAKLRQTPAPLQLPSALQLVGKPGSGVHAPCGSVSTGTEPQTPFAPAPFSAAEHASQPTHARSQQKPSAQTPLVHSTLDEQALPLALVAENSTT